MPIYIDPPRWPAHGTTFSHVVSDSSYVELHAFAAQLGAPPHAFDADHYDVPARLYDDAVAAGAIPVSNRELITILRESGLRVPSRERPKFLEPVLLEKWRSLMMPEHDLGEVLLERWKEPHRRYHTQAHLDMTLRALEVTGALLDPEDRRIVELAIWFHDAVYDGVPGVDEEKSAVLAEESLPASLSEPVAWLVRCTATHEAEPGHPLAEPLIDADLSILGASPLRYKRYVHQVRDEYSHVSQEEWRLGRTQVLQALLAREQLFLTGAGKDQWEAQARENMSRELAALQGN